MNEIMPHAQWMKLTYGGITSIRSSELKKVDATLAAYDKAKTPANIDPIRQALVGWMKKEGANWKSSVRNKFSAVDDLYRQVMDLPGPSKTGQDIVAVSHLRDESRAIVTDLFCGKTLDWRPGLLKKLAMGKLSTGTAAATIGSTARNVNTLSGGAITRGVSSGVHSIPRTGPSSGSSSVLAQSFCKALIPPDLLQDVTSVIAQELPSFMTDLAATLTPFLGVITTGAGAVWSACKTMQAQYRVHDSRVHLENSLCIDEPRRAIEGLIRLLERERNGQEARAAIGMAEFGGKLAGVLADGGTVTNAAIGVAASAAKFAVFISEVVLDVKERKTANRLMLKPSQVDGTDLIETCPIIGAYLICCVPTSVMVNTVFDRFFQQGWRGEVEYTVQKHLVPLRDQSRRLIKEHRFWIPELQQFPGVMEVNKKKLKEMAKRNGKSDLQGFGSSDFFDADQVATRPRR